MFGGEFPLTKSMEPLESFIVQTSSDFRTFATTSAGSQTVARLIFNYMLEWQKWQVLCCFMKANTSCSVHTRRAGVINNI